MLRNRVAQQMLKETASRVGSGVRQGVSTLVEQETSTLRARVDQLERELAIAHRQIDELAQRVERLERK